ncbi:MAG: hypothetical protein PHW03_07255 [Eubacteriales bacterium]|nr:hypothetical protein [Eubacteriales bacterium]
MARTSVDISFGLVDVTAKSDTTAACDDKQLFIDLGDMALEGVYAAKAATLEKDYWKLDGTFDVFPDNPDDYSWGLWSESMSDEHGTFENPIVLTLSFESLHESIGLTFEFNPYGNNYCNNLNIKWYRYDDLLQDTDFQPNNWRYACMQMVENYNKIVITFRSTNIGYRYLKVQNIMHGIIKEFGGSELKSADLLEEVDLSGGTLSVNTLDFTIYSQDDEFNIFNPEGIYTLLQKKQQLIVTGTTDGRSKNLGSFYVESMESQKDKILSIDAIDGVGIMDGTTFMGGMYGGITASALIETIMDDAGFGYTLDAALSNKTVTGYLPICSHREALQHVAFAVGGYVSTARSGTVNIRPVPNLTRTPDMTIGRNRKMMGTTVKLRTLVTGVDVMEHSYTLESTKTEACKVSLSVGLNTVIFGEPFSDVETNLGTITESGVNYCIINATVAGECTIIGYRYTDNTKTVSVRMIDLPAGEKENIVSADSTLLGAGNAAEVAQRLFNYYQYRIEQSINLVADEERVGSLVDIETEYGVYRGSIIESMDTSLTGGFVSKVVTIGA